jgi:hypothetical protein
MSGVVIGLIGYLMILSTSYCSAIINSHILQLLQHVLNSSVCCLHQCPKLHKWLPTLQTAVWRLNWNLDSQAGGHLTPASHSSPLNYVKKTPCKSSCSSSRHRQHRKHCSSVAVPCYLADRAENTTTLLKLVDRSINVVLPLFDLRSLPNNGCTCHNILGRAIA